MLIKYLGKLRQCFNLGSSEPSESANSIQGSVGILRLWSQIPSPFLGFKIDQWEIYKITILKFYNLIFIKIYQECKIVIFRSPIFRCFEFFHSFRKTFSFKILWKHFHIPRNGYNWIVFKTKQRFLLFNLPLILEDGTLFSNNSFCYKNESKFW